MTTSTVERVTGIPGAQLAAWVRRSGTPPRIDMDTITRRHRGHFFDPEAMRFFRSRLPEGGHALPNGGAAFVTSEQHVSYSPGYRAEPRRYTVRIQTPNGDISPDAFTRGADGRRAYLPAFAFQAHASGRAADRAAVRFALAAWIDPTPYAAAMLDMYRDGWTTDAIGDSFGITRQRAAALLHAEAKQR